MKVAKIAAVAFAVVATGGVALGFGSFAVIAGAGITVSQVAMASTLAAGAFSSLSAAAAAKKAAKALNSTGTQLDLQTAVNAPVPFVLGRTAVAGYVIDEWAEGADNSDAHLKVALSGTRIKGIQKYLAGDYEVSWSGDPNTGMVPVATTSPASELYKGKLYQAWFNGSATDNQQLTGLAHVHLKAVYDTKRFPQGMPESKWVLEGSLLYDPRKDSTYPGGSGSHRWDDPDTHEFSENPYIHALNYALGYRVKDGSGNLVRIGGIGAPASQIEFAPFLAGANLADEMGWKVGGVIDSQTNKKAVLDAILIAGSGESVIHGASISCIFNAPKAVLDTLRHEDVADAVEITNTASWRDRINKITPKYRAESSGWEFVTGASVSIPGYVADDGGELRTKEIEYSLVQDASQANQLAAYDLVNTREFLQFSVVCKPRMLGVRVGDCINVELPGYGINSQKCLIVGREFDPATYRVKLLLRSETDTKHDWALGRSDVAPTTPALGGYDPANPDAPANLAWIATGTTITGADGVAQPAIIVTGATDDVNASSVIFEYRKTGQVEWTKFVELPADTKRVEITGLEALTAYDVAISYRTVRDVVADKKLVLTGIYTGSNAVPWANGVITGVPLSLTDQINGYLQAKYIKFEGQVIPDVLNDYANTIAEHNEQIHQLQQNTGQLALEGYAKREELDELAYASIQNVLDDDAEAVETKRLAYLNGIEIGTVVLHEQTRTDDLVETIDVMGAKNANGTAFIFDTSRVQVGNGVSMASKFTAIEAATANATAFTVQQFNAMANSVAAEANARTALGVVVANNAAVANQQFATLANTTTSLSQFQQLLGATNGSNSAVILDTSKVYITPTESLSTRNALTEARFNGTSSSYLLNSTQAASSTANSAVSTLQQMGATVGNGSAFRMDSTKIDVSGWGTLAQTVNSLSSQISGKPSYADVSATVSTQVTAATGPGSSIASQITSAQSTAGTANSNATLALSAANGNSAQAALLLGVNGRISGFKVNGVTQTFEIIASRFSIVDNSGGTPIVPFVYSGGEVYIQSLIAQRVAANVITGSHIQASTIKTDNLIDNSVTVPTITSASNTVFGSGFGQSILSQYVPLTKAGQVSATAAIAQHFPSGTRNWSFDLYINGSLVYRCYGANGQDSIALAGALYCPAGNILVEIIWTGQNSGVNIDYRSLTCSGNMK
jgi:hypothetical protein